MDGLRGETQKRSAVRMSPALLHIATRIDPTHELRAVHRRRGRGLYAPAGGDPHMVTSTSTARLDVPEVAATAGVPLLRRAGGGWKRAANFDGLS
jgi:hypothetical protein